MHSFTYSRSMFSRLSIYDNMYVNISHILCPSLDSDHPTHSWCTIDRCTGPARFFASYFLVRKRGACLGTLNIYTTDQQKWKKHIFLKYTYFTRPAKFWGGFSRQTPSLSLTQNVTLYQFLGPRLHSNFWVPR